MCGIFGVSLRGDSELQAEMVGVLLKDLFRFSESRGKEAAGLAIMNHGKIEVLKRNVPASTLVASKEYRKLMDRHLGEIATPFSVVGHSRLVTNGARETHGNNQPVIVPGATGVHNGIVVNTEDLVRRFPDLVRANEVDSEVLFLLIRRYYDEHGTLEAALKGAFDQIRGAAAIALMLADSDTLTLATNNGNLYTYHSPAGFHLFASERHILESVVQRRKLTSTFGVASVERLPERNAEFIELRSLRCTRVPFEAMTSHAARRPSVNGDQRQIVDLVATDSGSESRKGATSKVQEKGAELIVSSQMRSEYDGFERAIAGLRRCTKCVLPETVPSIHFDPEGVCSYCHRHQPYRPLGEQALSEALGGPSREHGADHDCVVAISGGRDSCYALHYLVKELGLRPLAYTYDWGMVTDLARRNVSRLCGALGVEHVLVSADIPRKRLNIKKNVLAWLKRPDLGTVPLFMAGDKQFYYHANQLKKRTGIKRDVWSGNPLERTDFKVGFCGLTNRKEEFTWHKLTAANKVRIAAYYGLQALRNPAYLNASLADTLFAFVSYYLIPQNNVLFFNYIAWDEDEIVGTLRGIYDWELATDTTATWRIGDGTAPFYNYIYYTIAGFSEADTFFSNMIREGMIERAQALERTREENRPRFESIKCYTETIGIDFEATLRRINEVPRLYAAA